jgi:hypothetical protein
VSETERETAGAVRSASVAHFFTPDWTQVALRAAGALERTDRSLPATQLLVTVPDGPAALALAREIRALPAGAGLRVLPVMSPTRAMRVLKESPAHVVVGTPSALAGLIGTSAIHMGGVHTLLLAAADEYETQMESLATVITELPRESARILTAAGPTPLVEEVLERHLHRARRVFAPPAVPVPIGLGTPPTIYVRTVTALAPLAPIGELLDELDPPSAAIVVPDTRAESRVRTSLEALGYPSDSPLVTVTRDQVALHTQLVLFAGLPAPAAIAAALAAHPARLVALITARQRAALAALAKGAVLMPYERSQAARTARQREDTLRGTVRAVLAEGLPVREIAALEPLLLEFDGLEIAGAALRLYETARSEAAAAHLAGREEVRAELRAAKAERDAADVRLPHPRAFDRPKSPTFDRSRPGRGRGDDRGGTHPARRDDKGRPPRREK